MRPVILSLNPTTLELGETELIQMENRFYIECQVNRSVVVVET